MGEGNVGKGDADGGFVALKRLKYRSCRIPDSEWSGNGFTDFLFEIKARRKLKPLRCRFRVIIQNRISERNISTQIAHQHSAQTFSL